MAKGNWNPSVIKPKTRCRLCGRVIKKNDVYRVYLRGVSPAHLGCAYRQNKVDFTEWFEPKQRNTEIMVTESVSLFTS